MRLRDPKGGPDGTPPPFGGSADIANILASFTSEFTDILEFVSKFTNVLVNLLVIDHSICNILPCNNLT